MSTRFYYEQQDYIAQLNNMDDVAMAYDKKYLGAKAADPSLDNQGAALAQGAQYYNTVSLVMRIYTGSAWINIVAPGSTYYQDFNGDGTTVDFTLTNNPGGIANTQVYLNGVYQQKTTYTVSGAVITFSTAPPVGTSNIEVVTSLTFTVADVIPMSSKDAAGGVVGMTLQKINFKNVLNTITSFFTNSNTAQRTYTFQDRDGTIADNTDLGLKASLASLAASTGASLVGYADSTVDNILKNSVGKVVASIAALKAIDKTKYTEAFVTGYYKQGDGGGGAYWYDSTDTTSTDNGGTIIVASDGGRWKLVFSDKVHVRQFGAKCDWNGSSGTNDAVAVQAALDAMSPTQGSTLSAGTVQADIFSPMLIGTSLNLTNSRTGGTLKRDGLRFIGFNIIGQTGAGTCVIETTGSQWLELDGVITSGASNKSTVGVFQGVSTVLPQTQNQKMHLRIIMHDDAAANGGLGTVGIWNYGAEENAYDTCYIQANVPAVFTSHNPPVNFTATTPSSYQTLSSSHSLGVSTWSGECFLAALNQRKPSLITEDVNSFHMENVYMSNIGAGGGNLDCWWQFGAFQGGFIQGTIEQFHSFKVNGTITGAKIRITFGTLLAGAFERIVLIRGGQGQLVDCDIDLQDTTTPNRPLLTATPSAANELISCFIRNTTIRCNADKQYLTLPENLLWNPSTGNVTIEGVRNTNNPYRYTIDGNGKQSVTIPKTSCLINGGITSAEVIRFVMPTIIGSSNALSASVRVSGIATIQGSGTNSKSTRYIEAVIAIVVSNTGTISTSNVTDIAGGPQVDANSGGNSITAVALGITANTTYLQFTITPTRTGANLEMVEFIGDAEMRWTGNESRAPSLQLLS